jgi:NADPH-dependent glutamate synthase beta subunit-like oxidoreductase
MIEAVGQGPDLDEFDTNKLRITRWNTIEINEKFFILIPQVLAGDDCVTGLKSVVDAAAHGEIIANHIRELILSK